VLRTLRRFARDVPIALRLVPPWIRPFLVAQLVVVTPLVLVTRPIWGPVYRRREAKRRRPLDSILKRADDLAAEGKQDEAATLVRTVFELVIDRWPERPYLEPFGVIPSERIGIIEYQAFRRLSECGRHGDALVVVRRMLAFAGRSPAFHSSRESLLKQEEYCLARL
jgi:hypothetical protein